MAVTVVVRQKSSEERELALTLDAPRVVLGRSEGCEVRLPDPSVSARHASIRQKGGEYVLVDEGSSNGTFLGAVRLPPQTPRVIQHGELVRLGRVWLEIRIEHVLVKGSTAAAAKELALELVARGLVADGDEPSPKLEVIEGPDRGLVLTLDDPTRDYLVGRASEAEMRVGDPGAGRRHAVLARKGDALIVRDLGSPAGTFIDGARVNGDGVVKLGQTLELANNVLRWTVPAADALAEIERCPDERLRAEDVPPLPARASSGAVAPIDAPTDAMHASTPTPPPLEAMLPAATPTPPPVAARDKEGRWGALDAAVAFLAMGVLAVSAVGAWWLFR